MLELALCQRTRYYLIGTPLYPFTASSHYFISVLIPQTVPYLISIHLKVSLHYIDACLEVCYFLSRIRLILLTRLWE